MSVSTWLKERVPVDFDQLRDLTNEPIPGHMKRWWFALGGTPAYLFMVQIVTGILLLFYYVPEAGHAYESVARISTEVRFGWWLRSLHKWSATGMIVALCLHTMRVFFTGAYRKPRELTWVFGCVVLFLSLAEGLTGYSLVYEQLSYWGATVTSNLAAATPFVGKYVASFLRGGEEVGPSTLTRFFVVHVAVLPAILLCVVAIHIFFVRVHGVSKLEFRDQEKEPKTFPFIPDHLMTELSIALTLMILLNLIAVIFPAGLGEAANPQVTPEHIRPEWYFYFAFRWLKLTSLKTGVIGVLVAAVVMVFWPLVDRGLRRLSPNREVSIGFGVSAVLVVIIFTVWEALV